MVGEPGEIAEHVAAMLALVYLVPPVCLNVCSEVVTSSVPSPTDVTGEGFLPSVNPHVATEVGRSNELSAANHAREWSFRLLARGTAFGGTSDISIAGFRWVDVWNVGGATLVDHDDRSLHQGVVSTHFLK